MVGMLAIVAGVVFFILVARRLVAGGGGDGHGGTDVTESSWLWDVDLTDNGGTSGEHHGWGHDHGSSGSPDSSDGGWSWGSSDSGSSWDSSSSADSGSSWF